MSPILHIICLGVNGLDNLSLATYKTMKKADLVWVWSEEYQVVKDMLGEGIKVIELVPGSKDIRLDSKDSDNLKTIQERVLSAQGFQEAVLALPGNFLAEGKLVNELKRLLHGEIIVDTGLLKDVPAMEKLMKIMAELRSEEGCPWDREQTHETLKKYLVEETYEVLDAIDSKNMNNLCEELGDLLLQVVFHAGIAEESSLFTLTEVITSISQKLIRRHPHVFGASAAKSGAEVIINWDAIKESEKNTAQGQINAERMDFFKLPRGLPALMMAEKVQMKAGRAGFDWDVYQGPLAKIYEELAELEKEINHGQRQEEEMGDLLFSIVNLSRFLGVNAEEALRLGTKKFQNRFNKMMALFQKEDLRMDGMDLKQMDIYWEKAKKEEKNGI